MNLLGALLIVVFGFLFVTVSSRLTGEIGSSSNPISGMTVATLLLTCLIFLLVGWTGADVLRHRAVGRRHRLHRRVQRRHDVAGPEDRLPGRRHAALPADRHPDRRAGLGAGARADPAEAERRGDGVRAARQQVAPHGAARSDVDELSAREREPLARPAGDSDDAESTASGTRPTIDGGPAGKYLVDDAGTRRVPRRSRHQRHASTTRPDGTRGARSSTRRRRR